MSSIDGTRGVLTADDLRATIRATKRILRARIPDLRKSFAQIEELVRRDVDEIQEARAASRSLLPAIDFGA